MRGTVCQLRSKNQSFRRGVGAGIALLGLHLLMWDDDNLSTINVVLTR